MESKTSSVEATKASFSPLPSANSLPPSPYDADRRSSYKIIDPLRARPKLQLCQFQHQTLVQTETFPGGSLIQNFGY